MMSIESGVGRSFRRSAGFLRHAWLIGLLVGAPGHADPVDSRLLKDAMAFMDAYVGGDWPGVERHLTRGTLTVYGSDAAEFTTTRAGFKSLFENDQKLWNGQAHFGPMANVSSVRRGNLATLFFDREFAIGAQKLPVRFSTVWRLEGRGWRLVQSSNVVPTSGQSAEQILAKPRS